MGLSANSAGTSYNNSTGIGYGADCTASNQVRIGNSSVTSIGGYEPWTDISDARFKRNITENVAGIAFIKLLRPVTYHKDLHAIDDWWAEHYNERDSSLARFGYAKEQILYTGFIAQEVEAVANSLGYEFSGVDAPKSDKDFYGLRYSTFVVPLVKAVQEQQEMIEFQNTQLGLQQQQLTSLQSQLDELKMMFEHFNSQIDQN
jgi:hypothetical protein